MRIINIGFIVLVVGLSSCAKYKEGPSVSVLPRKERIEGKWIAESAKYNSNDSLSVYKNYIWEFTRQYSVILQIGSVKTNGVWSTVTNDKDFVIDFDNGSREMYEIIKMTNKEFWIRNKISELELHLKQK